MPIWCVSVFEAAVKAEEENRRIASLREKRPDADAIRAALTVAMADTMTVAPKTDVAQDAPLKPSVEVASSMSIRSGSSSRRLVEETGAGRFRLVAECRPRCRFVAR